MNLSKSLLTKKSYDPYFLLLGHTCCDINQGALPAIMAYLYYIDKIQSMESIAWIIFASNIISSVIQPLAGYFSDKKPRPELMSIGVVIASMSTSLLGFVDNYEMMFILAICNGFGIAIFHPAGGKTAHALVDDKKLGKGLSIFYVGGNIGFAIGPVLATCATVYFGPSGTAILLIPGILLAIIFNFLNPKFIHAIKEEHRTLKQKKASGTIEPDRYGAFGILTITIFCRAIIIFGFTTFIPLYWMKVLDQSLEFGNTILSIIAVIGAFATICGGILTDKFGVNRVYSLMLTLFCPMLIAFTFYPNLWFDTIIIMPIALCLYSSSSPMMVMGQRFLCNHTGLASGVTVGLAVSFGGIASPFLGWIGDNYGLTETFTILCILAFIGMTVSYFIPNAYAHNENK